MSLFLLQGINSESASIPMMPLHGQRLIWITKWNDRVPSLQQQQLDQTVTPSTVSPSSGLFMQVFKLQGSPESYLAPRQLGEALNADEGCVAYKACQSINSLRPSGNPQAMECAPDGHAACQRLL